MNALLSTVGAVTEQVRGVTYKKPETRPDPAPGFIPLLGASQIRPEGIDVSGALHVPMAAVRDNQLLQEGDVLVATSSGSLSVVGKAARFAERGQYTFGAFCKVLRPIADRVDSRYLAHALRTADYRRRISAVAAGANINNLRGEHLAELPLRIPPLDEQRRIADVLDRADALRAIRRATLARLDELKQSIFVDMFGTTETRDGCELNGLLFSIDSGKSPQCASRPAGLGEKGVLKLGAISHGTFRPSETKAVLNTSDVRDADEVRRGDVLLARKNTPELVGSSAYVRGVRPGLFMPDLIFRLVPDTERIRPRYLRDALSSDSARRRLRSLAGGSAASMSNISKAKLGTMRIPVPPLDIQLAYEVRVEAIEVAMDGAQRQVAHLDGLFTSLQQRAFRGDLSGSAPPRS